MDLALRLAYTVKRCNPGQLVIAPESYRGTALLNLVLAGD